MNDSTTRMMATQNSIRAPSEAEERRHQSDDEKDDGPVE
jgi:hypothetical protein